MTTYVRLRSNLAQFLEWEMFQTKVLEKIKTHFIFNNFFPSKIKHLWDNVEKFGRASQATHDNMAHALCMLENKATDKH
jgi:hypothetical protein